MAILKNAKWEKFAQGLADGKSQTQAYIDAGFSPKGASGSATTLLKHESSIFKRRDEILAEREEARRAAVIQASAEEGCTLQDHLKMLSRLRDEARFMGQLGAAINAEKNRGVVLGYYVTRNENGSPGDFANLADEALRKRFAEKVAQLEAEKAIKKASAG